MQNGHIFTFAGQAMIARPSGALYWPAEELLVVSDLHLGKSERISRRSGALLPPYEVQDTLTRLEAKTSVCTSRLRNFSANRRAQESAPRRSPSSGLTRGGL